MVSNKERGLSAIILLLVLVVLSAFAAYWYLYIRQPTPAPLSKTSTDDVYVKTEQNLEQEQEVEEFTALEEDASTPEEIDNEAMDELDQLILSVEGDEDLSDLGEY